MLFWAGGFGGGASHSEWPEQYSGTQVCLRGVSLGCLWGMCLWCVSGVCLLGVSPGCLWGLCLWCVSGVCLWGVSLIHAGDTPWRHTPETHPGDTPQRHTPETHPRDTPWRHTPETHPRNITEKTFRRHTRDTPHSVALGSVSEGPLGCVSSGRYDLLFVVALHRREGKSEISCNRLATPAP
jgi:hypothetical protein